MGRREERRSRAPVRTRRSAPAAPAAHTTPRSSGPNTQAVYYRDRRGEEPVRRFIDALGPQVRANVRRQLMRLNGRDPNAPPLPFPWTSQIEGDLREFRAHYGNTLYRVLHRRSRSLIILLHMFEKHTKAVPDAEKQIAHDRWADYEARMSAPRRVPPRAAGRDAP